VPAVIDPAWQRLVHQRLSGGATDTPEAIVAGLLAVQAQDFSGAKWAVAQRCGADDLAVQAAYDAGHILRTHVMRPTWHFVTPADIRWLLALTAPRVHAVSAYYFRKVGLDAAEVKRTTRVIEKVLGGGEHTTRDELGQALSRGRDPIDGLRLAYTLIHAELAGLVCSGKMRGKQHTYALLEARAKASAPKSKDEALCEIARRYLDGHGPAQTKDLAWWSGLTIAEAKRGLSACGAEQVEIDGVGYWVVEPRRSPRPKTPLVQLLPNYDELVIAFKDRSAMIDPNVVARTDVLSAHFVTVDGRIVGGWRRETGKDRIGIVVSLLRPLDRAERAGLDRAAKHCAQSVGAELDLEVTIV
jgi:hypothetical protein